MAISTAWLRLIEIVLAERARIGNALQRFQLVLRILEAVQVGIDARLGGRNFLGPRHLLEPIIFRLGGVQQRLLDRDVGLLGGQDRPADRDRR